MGLLAVWSLTPEAPGQLIALYEHSAFKQALIWNIDSFDQHMDPALPPFAGRAVMSLDWK
ncbi:hypothetical protein L5014_24790 [Paraburkholderia sp. RG36]|uniref:Uncharacterized protein n=1 Tax=Paraburkholderia tagetis TaxID=2913261 RepID=A0A9X1RSH1_9BURK|nr:hypothetical protein [Paraburkholderia tagetis]MCG5076543.1 hypothetical protein [Paraburkholderia tagetis]